MRRRNGCARRGRSFAALLCALVLAGAMLTPAVARADGMSGDMSAGGGVSGTAQAAPAEKIPDNPNDKVTVSPSLKRLTGETQTGTGESGSRETMGCVFPGMLDITTDPASISVGLECTMNDLCGIDPCTCGKPDAWGHCACAGFQEVAPTVTVTSSDESVASVVEALGTRWVVPHAAGKATITIHAELQHFQPADYTFDLEVQPFGAVDALLITAAVSLLVLMAIGVFFLVRGVVRAVRVAVSRRREHGARLERLRTERPATWQARAHEEGLVRRAPQAAASHPLMHEVRYALRDATPVLACAVVAFAVLVPISTTVVPAISVFNLDYTHEQLKYQFYAQGLGPFVSLCASVAGVALAFALFRFVLARKAVTAHFSVGIPRPQLFAVRFGVGAACCLLGVLVPFAASLAVNVAALGLYDGELAAFAFEVAGYTLVALVAFVLGTIAVLLSGSKPEAGIGAAVLLLGVTVVLWAAGTMVATLLPGSTWGAVAYNQTTPIDPTPLAMFTRVNPLLFFMDEGASKQFFSVLHPVYYPEPGDGGLLATWALIACALTAIALTLFTERRGEQAEMAGLRPICSLVYAGVAGLAGFAAALSLAGGVGVTASVVLGSAFFAGVAAALLAAPLRGRAPARRVALCVAGELAVTLAVVGVLSTGGLGFSAFVPGAGDVASVQVSRVGTPAYIAGEYAGVTHGAAYYVTDLETYTDSDAVAAVEKAHEQLVEDALQPVQSDTVPYDVQIRYTLGDGRVVARYYRRASLAALRALLSLDDDSHAKALEHAVVTGDDGDLSKEEQEALADSTAAIAYRTGTLMVADPSLSQVQMLDAAGDDRAALLNALAADLGELDASERYLPSSPVRAVLMASTGADRDAKGLGFSFNGSTTYVTDAYPHTLAWLQAHGYLADEASTPDYDELTLVRDDIARVPSTAPISRYFMAYRTSQRDAYWYDGLSRAGDTASDDGGQTITDAAKIAELVLCLRQGCFMDGGYLVRAHVRGSQTYTYLYLPAALVPDGSLEE